MSLAQLHYTSATAEDDGGGARFTAVSAGIPTPVLAEAEQLLGYEPPAGAPYHPTTGELRSFPEAFSFSTLSDGSHLLSRTVALGGPGAGGFHAHAVHLPAGTRLPGDALPITAWRSPNWASVAPVGGTPGPMAALPASAAFGPEALNDFAVSRSPWLAAVFADLRRVCEEPARARLVLVERQCADVARWIALAGAVLPPETAQRLTFTTYTRRPSGSPHRVVGVLPEDAPEPTGPDGAFLVRDCAGARPGEPVGDAWAETCARIWRNRSPELFRVAAELPGEPFAAGPLAVTALCAGVPLGPEGRAAAANWAAERPYALDEERTRQLTDALTAPGLDRTNTELSGVARLLTALDGRSAAATTATLGALLVTEAVHGGDVALEPPARSVFAGPAGERAVAALVTALGDDLRTELATGTPLAAPATPVPGRCVGRAVQLLRIARLLDVDCAELLPDVVGRMARSLLDEGPADCAAVLLDLLDEQFDVRTALLGELDRIAPQDPSATERLLAEVALPFTGAQALPHLRMCAAAPGARAGGGDDRVKVLNTVLRAGGMSPFTEPLVLRTAVGLAWGDGTPTAGEARLLLSGSTSDAHRTAGTWAVLVAAALGASADDAAAPELAHDLLRGFPQEIDARTRGALLLLEFARDVRSGAAEPGWAEQARKLCAGAEPVEPGVREQAFGALAGQLLGPDRPEAELYAFVHSDAPDLIAAYGNAARQDAVLARLRSDPAYVADCFTVWSSHPHAGRAWGETRAALLEEVLRPVVRGLSADEVAAVEEAAERAGSSRTAEAFRAWNRPGGLRRRLGSRLAARVRRS
ncbi:GTPase-associated protein 1-related protein [Streptomyces sp. NBC_00984]|uniref:GTPase-associated protein 1-related protein n=1 Tax=Streptomyces sp. NBC_00984 TaxID=2903700 RepID=UPI00386FB1C9|nr:GTPase-associated protein 1-related protein [Streptomyces sp. NBC_00984]